MKTFGKIIRLKKQITTTWKIGMLALLLAGFAPINVYAQVNLSCNADLEFGITGTTYPIFLDETIRISAQMGAKTIKGGTYQDIYAFGYALNCHFGEDFASCTSEGNTVEFLGNMTTDCIRPDGTPVELIFPQSNVIPITTKDGPIRTGENETCNVQFDARIPALDPSPGGDNIVVQAMGWPIKNRPATTCSNGLTSTASSTLAIFVQSCGIEVKKEVSIDGQTWYDANTEATALDLGPEDSVFYRLVVKNTSSIDYTEPMIVKDEMLGVDTTVDAIAAGETVIIGGAEIEKFNIVEACLQEGLFENVASVEGVCKGGNTPVTAIAQDNAFVKCTVPAIPGIDIEKATNGQDADSPTGPEIPVGDAVNWTYVVTNNGELPLSGIVVTDDQGVTVDCNGQTTLAVGASMTCTASGLATAGQYANIGTVNATSDGGPVSDTDPSHYFGTGSPSILILKEISIDGGSSWHDANDVGSAVIAVFPSDALYRFTVTNDGSAPLKDVVIEDSELGITGPDVYEVGNLAIGQIVVLTFVDIPQLNVINRCEGHGTFINTAEASGLSSETDEPASDNDAAVLKCIGEPHITILKEISPTGGDPWYDLATPPQDYPSDAWYRITVTNDGTAPLENVEVTDGDLSIVEFIGNLAVNEVVVLESGQVPELFVEDRCTGSGEVGNTALVSGTSADDPSDSVNDSNDATLVCVGAPMISIIKEISADGNEPWKDANTEGDALIVQAPSDAWYRITVKNIGPVGLTDVILNDGTIGIFDYEVGDIASGAEVVLTSAQISELHFVDRCLNRGTYGNTANVSGKSEETGGETSLATDSAWLECTGTPDIQIVKEISLTGSDPWYLDITPPQTPPSDAWYRLTVTNIGTSALENVMVNDPTLGVAFNVGDLLVGDTVVLTSGEVAELDQQNRCTEEGLVVNTASASGMSVEFPFGSVNDSDSVTLSCEEQVDMCEDGKPAKIKIQYDGDDDSSHSQDPSKVTIDPAFVIFPSGEVWIEVHDHKDKTLVLDRYFAIGEIDWVFGPRKLISSSYWFRIYTDEGGDLLQTINFHTSCSEPLNVGDEFGAITVLGGAY